MNPQVIYSDNEIIVVNKPPGMSVHGGFSVTGRTVADFLLGRFPEIKDVGEGPARPGIVHRLDKDTSGVLVAARNQKSFDALKKLFQHRLVEKTYLAIVCGEMKEKRGVISLAVGRLVKNPLKRGIAGPGSKVRAARSAITEYRVLKSVPEYSLVELKPKTGRMHQLRVHLKALGHPIACDRVYGGKNVCCPSGASRQLLHAASLSFSLPEGRKLYFEADPPDDFSSAVRQI